TQQGELGDAEDLLVECRRLCEERGEQWLRSHAGWAIALIQRATGRTAEAVANVKEAIRVKRLLHDVFGVLLAMDTLAALALDESDAERAAMLLGAVEANGRSEERRVGKEGRCRWAAQHVKKARERRACSAST